ncbi:hypothetical protein Y657_002371 [Salmonella enterica subsp. enterica]|nr:hypothetical protein [Salmonella enterica subsp. enterica]
MNRTDAPKKQPVPFGINGSREDLLATTPAGDNQASYDAGFPPVTMILKSAGGLPPKGQDMNQILYELSALSRWASSGALNSFDLAFATAIGGYPKGSLLLGDDGTTIYRSTIDANTNNPNSVPTGWFNLNTAYQPLDATLTAIADLATSANKLAYFTGTDAAALTDITSIGRSVIGQSTLSSLQAYLGMGAAAFLGVATNADMQTGTSTTLLSTAAGVNSLFPKRTFSANDYIRIPDAAGGLIIQWGVATSLPTGTGIATITYPTPFPNGPMSVMITRYFSAPSTTQQANPTVTNVTNTNFSLNIADSSSVNAMWIAIGH